MIATARIAYDRDYFETLYDESVQHRLKWRRYAIWFSIGPLLFGVFLAIALPQHWFVGGLFAVAGVYELAMAATHRRRWIHSRMATVHDDKTVRLVFHNTEMTAESPLGSSTMRYSGFDDFISGSHGFFLVPDTGVSIYVPRATLDDAAMYRPLVDMIQSQTGG